MKRNNKFMALAMAGALAVSNLSAVAIPMTAFAGEASPITIEKVESSEAKAINTVADATAYSGTTTNFTFRIKDGKHATATSGQISKLSDIKITATGVAKSALTIGNPTLVSGTSDANNEEYEFTVKVNGSATKEYAGQSYDTVIAVEGLETDQKASWTLKFDNTIDSNGAAGDIALAKKADLTKALVSDTLYVTDAPSKSKTDYYKVMGLIGDAGDAIATLGTPNGTASKIEYKSSDSNVFEVTAEDNTDLEPTLTLKSAGLADLIATYTYSSSGTKLDKTVTKSIKITVKVAPTSVAVEENGKETNSVDLTAKSPSKTLKATVKNTELPVNQNIIWVSKNDKIAKVEADGAEATITAIGNGSTTVYAVSADDQVFAKAKADGKKDLVAAETAGVVGIKEITVNSEGFDVNVTPSAEEIDVFVEKTAEVALTTNDTNVTPGEEASAKKIVYTVTSTDEDVATAKVDKTTGVVTVKGVKVGQSTIKVSGLFKVTNTETNKLEDKTITTEFKVNVVDPDAQAAAEDEAAKAKDEAAKAAADKAAAEEAATKAKADAAAQKAAAEAATKEATAAKEAAAKAAEAQKAAEAKAAEAEKKAAEADTTGIKKGATKAVKGQTFKATSTKAVTLTKIKNVKTVNVGSVVEINNKVYKVTALGKGALKAGKATKMTVDAQFLTKKGINKDCAKGTGKVKTLVIKNKAKKNAVSKALVTAFKKYNKNLKTVKYVN